MIYGAMYFIGQGWVYLIFLVVKVIKCVQKRVVRDAIMLGMTALKTKG